MRGKKPIYGFHEKEKNQQFWWGLKIKKNNILSTWASMLLGEKDSDKTFSLFLKSQEVEMNEKLTSRNSLHSQNEWKKGSSNYGHIENTNVAMSFDFSF